MLSVLSPTRTLAPRRWLGLIKAVWVLLVVMYLGVSLLALTESLANKVSALHQILAESWSEPEFTAALEELGLSVPVLTTGFVLMDAVRMLLSLGIALLIFRNRSDEWIGLISSAWLVAFGTVFSLTGSLGDSIDLIPLWLSNVLFSTVLILFFYFLFTFPDGKITPSWGHVPVLAFGAYVVGSLFLPENPTYSALEGLFITAILVLGALAQVYRYRRLSNAGQKQQTKWLILALVFFAALIVTLGVATPLFPGLEEPGGRGLRIQLGINLLFFALTALFPLVIGVSILRYRLWDMDVVLNRALIYGPLSTILAGIFAGLIALINQSMREMFGTESTTSAAVVSALLVATIFQPLRSRIESTVNKFFYRDQLNLTRDFIELAPEFRSIVQADELVRVLTARLPALLQVDRVSVELFGPEGNWSPALPIAGEASTSGSAKASIRHELEQGHVVSKTNQQGLWVPLYVRRLNRHDPLGVIEVGARADGSGFSSDLRRALADLGAEAGASIYAARLRDGGSEPLADAGSVLRGG